MSDAWKYAFAIARAVADVLRELERALDVVARGDVVAHAGGGSASATAGCRSGAGRTGAPSAPRASSASSKSAIAVEMLESL